MGSGLVYVVYAFCFLLAFAAITAKSFRPVAARVQAHAADIALVGTISFLYILLSGDLLWGSAPLPQNDNIKYAYPFFHHVIDSLVQTGELPYWLPYAGGGQPTFLYLNHAFLLHLPHLMAYALFPFYPNDVNTLTLYWWVVILQNLVFSLGCYLLLRVILHDKWAALYGFIVCLFSGITTGTLHQEQLMASIFYIPWVAIFALRYFSTGSMFWGALGALFLGFSLLSHYPHLVAYFWCILVISHAAFNMKDTILLLRSRWKQFVMLALIACAVFAVDATMLAGYLDRITSPMRFGQSEGVSYTYEMLTGKSALATNSLHPHTLLHYLFPQTFYTMNTSDSMQLYQDLPGVSLGQWKLDNLVFYLGLIPVFFTIYAFIKVRDRLLMTMSLAIFITFLFAMGGESFGYYILFKYVPMATLQRIPVHLANYINLFLIIISAAGFRAFTEKESGGQA